jgi:hypothetical protein
MVSEAKMEHLEVLKNEKKLIGNFTNYMISRSFLAGTLGVTTFFKASC